MNIFVGNLSFDSTEADVRKLFEGFGNVASVVIVMSKEKKAPKSRGFGFVEMPDEQQALAAIAALNENEFMGRILNAEPARPKTESEKKHELKKKMHLKPRVQAQQHPNSDLTQRQVRPFGQHLALKDRQVRPSGQPGTYKGGRRTRSYMSRKGLAGKLEEAKPRRSSQDNPMRWRKRGDQPKPWQHLALNDNRGRPSGQKSSSEHKPWERGEAGESKPWKKTGGKAKPWGKSSGRPQKSGFKGRKKPGGFKR